MKLKIGSLAFEFNHTETDGEHILEVIGILPISMGYVGPLDYFPQFRGKTLDEAIEDAKTRLPDIMRKKQGKQ